MENNSQENPALYRDTNATPQPANGARPESPQLRRLKRLFSFSLILFTILLIVASGFAFFAYREGQQNKRSLAERFSNTSIPLDEIAGEEGVYSFDSRRLLINGILQVEQNIVLSPGEKPDAPVEGQLYYDSNKNELGYYNGNKFIYLTDKNVTSLGGQTGDIALGNGLQLSDGVLSVVPQQGGANASITYTAGNGLVLNGTEFAINSPTCNGTDKLRWSGAAFVCAADVDTDTNTTYTAGDGIVIDGSNAVSIDTAGAATGQVLTFDGSGVAWQSVAGGVSSLNTLTGDLTVNGTANQILVANGTDTITLSLPQDIATTSSPTFGGLTVDTDSLFVDAANNRVGVGTTAPSAKLHVADGSLLVTGTHGGGNGIAATGPGTRMFFDTNKSAFRAGTVFGSEWDNSSVGNYSFAAGNGVRASNSATVALGLNAFAGGYAAVALGDSTYAAGDRSIAFGSFTTALGNISTAFGAGTYAQSYASVALGRYNLKAGDCCNWIATDPLFVIGNGTNDTNRANALTLLKNGNLGLGTANPAYKLDVAGTVSATDLLLSGGITLNGHIIGNADTRGQVTVTAGNTSATYPFASAYGAPPHVVLTPTSDPNARYWVSNVTANDFTVTMSAAPGANVTFDFQVQQ